jgi:hypothetical protein
VTYLDTQRSVTPGLLRRTVKRIKAVLESLPPDYRFQVSVAIDKTPQEVRRVAGEAAEAAKKSNSLLLYYYFGHGALSADQELQFVHPGPRDREMEPFPLAEVASALHGAGARKVLMILDCCYAGALPKEFGAQLHGERCLLASTTPTAKAYVHYSNTEPPIGTFTRTIFDGFLAKEACVNATDNNISAQSLFDYAKRETAEITQGVQTPYMHGQLTESLAEYQPVPEIIPGLNKLASVKSGYYKIYIIGRALASRSAFPSTAALYKDVLRRHRKSFLTPYKNDNGVIEYRPAHPSVLARYLRFLRALGVVEREELRLSKYGRRVVSRWTTEYDESILEALDAYLARHELTRDRLQDILRGILSSRGLPTPSEIVDYLAPGGPRPGPRMPGSDLRLVLDLLGYAGAVRVAIEKVYFPW